MGVQISYQLRSLGRSHDTGLTVFSNHQSYVTLYLRLLGRSHDTGLTVFSDHQSYVTLYLRLLGRSHDTGLTVFSDHQSYVTLYLRLLGRSHDTGLTVLINCKTIFVVIQWLNKQINETQMTHQRIGTFEMPGATSKFRPTGTAVVCIIYI